MKTLVVLVCAVFCGAALGCSPADGPITVDQLPHVKVGRWQVVATYSSIPPSTSTQCSDGKLSFGAALLPSGCSQPSMKRVAGTYVYDISCPPSGALRSNVHSVAAGDFQSAYTIDTQDLFGNSHEVFKYIGPC
jgi:hypothetical protein